jgi:hypothetical protein
MWKTLKLILASLIISGPISFLLTFLLTPAYWRLEPILGIELAGHSGPSDWVFAVNFCIVAATAFALIRRPARKRRRK